MFVLANPFLIRKAKLIAIAFIHGHSINGHASKNKGYTKVERKAVEKVIALYTNTHTQKSKRKMISCYC